MTRTRTLIVLIGALSAVFAAGAKHVVVPGDTLWDITGAYLGDPFQWPQIWQRNPQIADAHWIYPGDTIHLERGGDAAAPASPVAAAAPEQVSSSEDPLAEFPLDPELQKIAPKHDEAVAKLAESPAQSVLNIDAMRVAPVHYGKSEIPVGVQSRLVWDIEGGRHMIRPGTVLSIGLGSDKGIETGALVEIVEADDRVVGFSDEKIEGRYEQVRGICTVVEVVEDSSRCLLERVYGDAGLHAYARVYNPIAPVNVRGFEAASSTDPARVIANTRNSRVQLPGNYVIIDRGTQAGVSEGDIYEFMAVGQRRGMAAMRGHGIVIRTTGSAATIFLVGVAQRPIQIGDRAWLIRKAVRAG